MHYGKQEVYNLLDSKGIDYNAIEHPAVYNMEELDALDLPEEGNIAKNLFIRDSKKKHFFLFVVAGEERVNIKELGEKIGVKGLSFASEKYLESILGIYSGAVSPLGVLNDEELKVKVYMDERFRNGVIAVHPNDNTASVWLNCNDLISIIKEHGNEVAFITYQ